MKKYKIRPRMTGRITVFLLVVLMSGLFSAACQPLMPEKTTPSASQTVVTTAPLPKPSPTPVPTATPSPVLSPTPAPTPVKPDPSPTVAPTETQPISSDWPHLLDLDNTKTGWSYFPASPLNSDLPATIPDAAQKLVQKTDALWQEQNPTGKTLYLTMDDGYEYRNLTSWFLDIARDYNVPITFFITGSYLAKNPKTVLRMVSEGHLVLNHTEHHPNLPVLLEAGGPEAVRAELTQVEDAFLALTGVPMPRYIRPPEGSYSQRLLTLLDQSGYYTDFWSFAYRDWLTDDQPDPDEALEKVLANLHPGSVILLHAVSETNLAILPRLIESARARGYQFKLITAMKTP